MEIVDIPQRNDDNVVAEKDTFVSDSNGVRRLIVAGQPVPYRLRAAYLADNPPSGDDAEAKAQAAAEAEAKAKAKQDAEDKAQRSAANKAVKAPTETK